MKQILAKAAGLALFSVAVSFLVLLSLASTLHVEIEASTLLFTTLCPLVIAFPVGAWIFRQQRRLADALEELTQVHRELAAAHALLSEKARRDEMTGVLNRGTFFAALKDSRGRAGVLLAIDVDHFKRINDMHGHQAGDEALMLIAQTIQGGVRDGDLVGRIGGEEFAAFLDGASPEEASGIAERIRCGVEAIPFRPGAGGPVPLSVSIGAARVRACDSWAQTMREADGRLYEAKRGGRNRVVFKDQDRIAA